MDLELLRTFTAIVELKSFSKAALSLHVSQSTVSTRIRALEDELNQKLLNWEGKTLQLTPAGKYFYIRARKLVAEASEAIRMMQEFSSASEFTLGVSPFCARYILLDIFPSLRSHLETTPMKVRTVTRPDQLIELFSKGIVDVCLLSAYNIAKGHQVELLWKEPTVLAARPGVVPGKITRAEDLARYPIGLLSPEKGEFHYSHQLLKICREQSVELKPHFILDDANLAKELVRQGTIVAFLPYLSVEEEVRSGELTLIPNAFSGSLASSIYLLARDNLHFELYHIFYHLLKENAARRMRELERSAAGAAHENPASHTEKR